MRNIIIVCTILVIAIATLAGKYFSVLSGKDNNITRVLNQIPADAAMIFHFNNDNSFYEIFKDYTLFSGIMGESRSQEIRHLKKLISTSTLSESLADKKVFLSLHPGKDSVEFLFSMNTDADFSEESLTEALSEVKNVSLKALYNDVYSLQAPDIKKPIYLLLRQGTAMASFSEELIKKCVNKKETHLDKNVINEIYKTSSKNMSSPINLFINHETIFQFLTHFNTKNAASKSSLLSTLKGSSALSMNFKSDAMMFNGISTTDTTKPDYLNIFLHQKPVPNTIKKILPQNTSIFLAFGLSDVTRFHKDLIIYLTRKGEIKKLEEQINNIRTSTGVDVNRDIKPLFDKEFVSVENSYGEKFAIIQVKNGRDINFKLQLISRLVNERISQLNYSHLFNYYFGEPLKSFSRPYFGVADNYLIIANTPGIITNFLNVYENDNFLYNTEEFRQYDQLVANQSNVFYFINLRKAGRTARSNLKPRYAGFIGNDPGINRFYGLSYQWASEGKHFFSNLYLSYNPTDSLALNN